MASASATAVNRSMETSMERLSTGLRINSAADDAAGLSISTRMEAQVRGLNQAIRNAADAQSLAATAEGAMNEMGNLLQRMGELAVQAANGAMNPSDRQAIQDEISVLVNEVDRIGSQTRFNNINLLDGSFDDTFQIGTQSGETVQLSIGDMRATAFGVGAFADNAMAVETARGNVEGQASIAQIDKITLSGAPASGDTFEIAVDDFSFTYTVTGTEGGIGGIRDAIAQRVNNTAGMKNLVSASAGGAAGELLLTAKTGGEGFVASAVGTNVKQLNSVAVNVATVQQNVAAVSAQAQVDQVTIAGAVEAGDQYSLTVAGQTVNYTVGTGDTTVDDIVTGLTQEFGKNAFLSASFTVASFTPSGGNAVTGLTVTANTPGTAFQTAMQSQNRVASGVTVNQTNSIANAELSQEEQVIEFSGIGPVEQNDRFELTIGTNTVSYTANTGDTITNVRDALTTAIGALNGNAGITNLAVANVGATQMKLTASNNAEFTVTARSVNNSGSTNDNTITVNAATQNAQAATVGLSEFVVSNANLKVGEALEFTVNINGTAVTTATDYTVVANDLVDQTAFRNRLVTHLNADANMIGAATTPVFSAGKDAQSIDITAGGTGTSAHVGAGSVKSDTIGTSKVTFNTDTTGPTAGDTITFEFDDNNGNTLTSATYTLTAGDVGATAGATLVSNLATFLNNDAAYTNKFSFQANGLDLEITALVAGEGDDVDTANGVTVTASGTALANAPTIAAITAGADGAATSGSSFAVRTAPLDAQSQVQSVTITGTIEKGDVYTFNHGTTEFEYTVLGSEGPTLAHLRNAIVTAMNANGSSFSGVATAANGAGEGDIILTSGGNSAVTITGSATDRGSSANAAATVTVTAQQDAVKQVEQFVLTGDVEEGDQYALTINGTTTSYTATAADVAGGMRALTDNIIAAVNAGGSAGTITATRSGNTGNEFFIEADTAGTAFVGSLAVTNRSAAAQTTNVQTTTANRAAVTAVAQQDAVTIAEPGGSGFTAGLTFEVEASDGTNTWSYQHTTIQGETAAQVISALNAGFNALTQDDGGNSVAPTITASIDPNNSRKLLLTADTAGVAVTSSLTDGTATAAALGAERTSVQENQGGIAAVAQQNIVQLSGTVEGQDVYSVTVNDVEVSFTLTGMEKTLDNVANTLADLINANGNLNSKVLAETAGNGQLRLTSKTAGEGFTLEVSASNGAGGSLANMSVMDQEQAASALNVISASLERVNSQRSALGAVSNRLDHTISNLTNVVINTESAKSRILDADFAAESTNLAKSQILQQASMAMLAQANASKQGVLSLLQG
jgi:flagellin